MIDWSDHWKAGCTFILVVCLFLLFVTCLAITFHQ